MRDLIKAVLISVMLLVSAGCIIPPPWASGTKLKPAQVNESHLGRGCWVYIKQTPPSHDRRCSATIGKCTDHSITFMIYKADGSSDSFEIEKERIRFIEFPLR